MTVQILSGIGHFSTSDAAFFEKYTSIRSLKKNDFLLKEGEICRSLFYVLSGSFCQYQEGETAESIIDLHLEKEWMFNQPSLTAQSPSATNIKAFTKSEVVELGLGSLHQLISQSRAFLQFGCLLNQSSNRTHLFDNALTPAGKYAFISTAKPMIAQIFPVKMIAAYLKITPETLSRVRANYRIS